MAITATQVKALRDRTGIPMMKCKQALEASDGDEEAAIEHLRKQGLQTADKKADRATNAGALGVAVEGGTGTMVLLACETDFVSGNADFKAFVQRLAEAALAAGSTDAEALAAAQVDGVPVPEAIAQQVAKMGENMQLAAVQLLSGDVVAGYNHGGRVATLVAGSGDPADLRKVAMHVAAASPAPIALSRDGIPQELLDKERELIAASPDVQAKPEHIRPKIVEGKLGRFYKEHVLLEQEMLGDPEDQDAGSVAKWAEAHGVGVTGFARMSV